MDENRPLKSRAVLRVLLKLFGPVLFSPLALAACFTSEPPALPKTSSESFSQLVKNISQRRALPVKRDLAVEQALPAPAASEAPATYRGMPLAAVEAAYKSVGLLPGAADLNRDLREYLRLERLAAYEQTSGKIFLAQNLSTLSSVVEQSRESASSEAPLIFAVMAALQEQHFKWPAIIDSVSVEDRRLAFRAVAAGDALLAVMAHAAGSELSAASLRAAGPIADELEKLGARLPAFFRQQAGFPFRYGSRFVWWAFKAGGWSGVNALYAKPPLSTAEILHPEKYFIRRQLPLRFFPPVLLRRFRGGAAVEQSFGEYLIGALLAAEHGAGAAERLAAAWRGDQLFAFQDGRSLATVWLSSWQDENDAREFTGAYRRVLEARHRLRFERRVNGKTATLTATGRDRRGWVIEAQGASVIAASSASAENSLELARQAWQDLEIDPESTAIPFESAGRLNHFSSSSR